MNMQARQGSPRLYVVSLLRAAERRKAISEQLQGLGQAFTFVDAVDARAVDADWLHGQVDNSALMDNEGRLLSGPEIGCALSHREIYKDIVRTGAAGALVLEDDVIVTPAFCDVVAYFERMASSIQEQAYVVHLGAMSRRYGRYLMLRRRSRQRISDRVSFLERIDFLSPQPVGTEGYYITRRGAQAWLAHNRVQCVADRWTLWAAQSGGRIFISVPPAVLHPLDRTDSEIEVGRKLLTTAKHSNKILDRTRNVFFALRARAIRYFVKPFVERFF